MSTPAPRRFFTRIVQRHMSLTAAIVLAVGACTTVETQSYRASKAGNVEMAQIATDADFSRYDRLQAVDM